MTERAKGHEIWRQPLRTKEVKRMLACRAEVFPVDEKQRQRIFLCSVSGVELLFLLKRCCEHGFGEF